MQWADFDKTSDIEHAWQIMEKNIRCVIDEMCPIRTFKILNYRPDWMNNLEQIADRDYFYKKAKKTGCEDDWNIAKHLRNLTNYNIRQARAEFIKAELEGNKKDSKKFWRTIKKVFPNKSLNRGVKQTLVTETGRIGGEEVAQYINEFFANVGKPKQNLPTYREEIEQKGPVEVTAGDDTEIVFELEVVPREEVFRKVRAINVSKSSGIKDLGSFIVKQALSAQLQRFTRLVNTSMISASTLTAGRKQ